MIKKHILLRCSPARAFSLFTEHAGQWWPAERRHSNDDSSEIRIEPSGRFFERASNGTEVDLGAVLLFEANHRLVLDWFKGTGRDNPTRVDVRFEAVDGGTCVTVTHDLGDASPDVFVRNAPVYIRSWDVVLAALANHALRIA